MAGADGDYEQIDRDLMRLRRIVEPPGMVDDDGGRLEGSTILVLEALSGTAPQTVRDIAQRLDVAHSTASRLIKRAEEAGMVRRRSPVNKRETAVEPTEQGRAVRRRGVQYRIGRLAAITADWHPEEIERFATDLYRFAQAVAADSCPAASE